MINGASQLVLVVKNPPAHAGDLRDVGLIPGLGRSPGGGDGSPLHYSCPENPMDRGAWQGAVRQRAKSWTCLRRLSAPQHIDQVTWLLLSQSDFASLFFLKKLLSSLPSHLKQLLYFFISGCLC